MSLLGFFEWLAATPASIALHESRYAYLIVLTVHVMSLCLAVGMAVIMDLRLLGMTMLRTPASEVVSRLFRWALAGFSITIASGALLFYAAPVDKYGNLFFQAKMTILVIAALNVYLFHRTAYRRVAEWDLAPVPPASARLAGGIGLLAWALIILAGRMIPYQLYWFG